MSVDTAFLDRSHENLRRTSTISPWASLQEGVPWLPPPRRPLTPPRSPEKSRSICPEEPRSASLAKHHNRCSSHRRTEYGKFEIVDTKPSHSQVRQLVNLFEAVRITEPYTLLTPPPSPMQSPACHDNITHASEINGEAIPMPVNCVQEHITQKKDVVRRCRIPVLRRKREGLQKVLPIRPVAQRLPRPSSLPPCFDGCDDGPGEAYASPSSSSPSVSSDRRSRSSEESSTYLGAEEAAAATLLRDSSYGHGRTSSHLAAPSSPHHFHAAANCSEEYASNEGTPSTDVSPARGAYPFPRHYRKGLSPFALRRCPTTLSLPRASPSESLRRGHSAQSPDRFVPSRNLRASSRDRYKLSTPPSQLCEHDRRDRQQSPVNDPFRQPSRRRFHHVERGGHSRLPVPIQPVLNPGRPSAMHHSLHSISVERTISHGTVWTVGGSAPVLDGVQSVSNGRGGRIASGTNAPIYCSNFFGQKDPSDDQGAYEGRLAAAFGIDQATRVLDSSFVSSPNCSPPITSTSMTPSAARSVTNSPIVWRDNEWSRAGCASRTSNPLSSHQLLTRIKLGRESPSQRGRSRQSPSDMFRSLQRWIARLTSVQCSTLRLFVTITTARYLPTLTPQTALPLD